VDRAKRGEERRKGREWNGREGKGGEAVSKVAMILA
jgi:hypothetical protein